MGEGWALEADGMDSSGATAAELDTGEAPKGEGR